MKTARAATFAAAGVALLLVSGAAFAVSVNEIRMWRAPDRTQMVVDLDGPILYRVYTVENPFRVVVDMPGTVLGGRLPKSTIALVKKIRAGHPKPHVLRLVLDMARQVPHKAYLLPPGSGRNYRLVLTFPGDKPVAAKPKPAPPPKQKRPRKSPIIVAVDAGHGGEDPGAIGKRGTREKDVVLAVATDLARRIDKAPGMRAFLIRKGDYYVNLRKRINLAYQAGATLFVSIHADAVTNRSARGSSVYALSLKGASSETARRLARRENLSDFSAGINLHGADPDVAAAMMDMSMTSAINDSKILGAEVLKELKKIGPLHSERVEQAGFAVLKSPDIRSILVETAYISNPKEEKLLRSRKHRRKLAQAILRAIQNFCRRHKEACS